MVVREHNIYGVWRSLHRPHPLNTKSNLHSSHNPNPNPNTNSFFLDHPLLLAIFTFQVKPRGIRALIKYTQLLQTAWTQWTTSTTDHQPTNFGVQFFCLRTTESSRWCLSAGKFRSIGWTPVEPVASDCSESLTGWLYHHLLRND